jgi:hypothetical protein
LRTIVVSVFGRPGLWDSLLEGWCGGGVKTAGKFIYPDFILIRHMPPMQQARASEVCAKLIFANRFSKKKGRIAPLLPLTFVDQCSARGAKVKILKIRLTHERSSWIDQSRKMGRMGGLTNDNALFLNTL